MLLLVACNSDPPGRPPHAALEDTGDTAVPVLEPSHIRYAGDGSDWFGSGVALGPDYDGDGVRDVFFGAPMGVSEGETAGYVTWAPSSVMEPGGAGMLGGVLFGPIPDVYHLPAQIGSALAGDADHLVTNGYVGMYILGSTRPESAVANVENEAVASFVDYPYVGDLFVGPDADGDGENEIVFAGNAQLSVYSVSLKGSRVYDDRWLAVRYGPDTYGMPITYRPPVYDDLDGDGLGDLTWATYPGVAPPSAHVEYGPASPGVLSIDDVDAHLVGSHNQQRADVTPVGDIDGDGSADLVVSSPPTSVDSGSAYVWLTHPEGTHDLAEGHIRIRGFDDAGFSGWLVAIGDPNGDGTGDFVGGGYEWAALLGGPIGEGTYDLDDVARWWWNLGGTYAVGTSIGDLDGDGAEEFAMGWGSTAGIYFGPY